MKHIKQLLTTALAFVLVMLMVVPAFAAETRTVNNETNHAYKAYQIFAGTQNDVAGDASLGDIEWGNAVDTAKMTAALAASTYFKTCTTAEAVAAILTETQDRSAQAIEFSKIAHNCLKADAASVDIAAGATSVALDAGYYLIVDQTEITAETVDEALNPSLLQVTKKGDIHIAKKYSVPNVEKGVSDGSTNVYTAHADLNIGDNAHFQLIGTLPTNLSEYSTYKYGFHDSLSKGLTYNNDAKVYVYLDGDITNADASNKKEVTSSFTTASQANGERTDINITSTNVKAVEGLKATSKFVVEYTAKLNSDAEVGNPGNDNEVYLTYSNNPNGQGEGKTTPDKAYVFTFELDVKKVEITSLNPLANAKFVLYRLDKDGNREYVKVDDSGKITGWVTIAKDTTDPDKAAVTAGASTLVSGEDGFCKVTGIDKGTYYLQETQAPAGYNKISTPFQLVIEPTYETNATDGSEDVKVINLGVSRGNETYDHTGNAETGTVTATVKNDKGLSLPETGGMGTTLLYTIGGALVIGSGILIVSKKRMSKDK